MRRVPSVEILDAGLLSSGELHGNLNDLWRINRWLGGVSGSLHLLSRFLERTGKRRLRVLEVGAGDGRLAGHLRQALRGRGVSAEFFTLDRRLRHLLEGRPGREGVHPVVADALALPFAAGAFDLATCNLVLHHFSGEQALVLLRALGRVARQAVLINDLERHWLAYGLIRVAPWFWRNRVSRLDGLASVRQAYTERELEELAAAAGFRDFEVHRIVPFRLGLVLWNAQAPEARSSPRAEWSETSCSR